MAPAERLIVIPNGVSRPAEVRRDLRLLDDATGAPLIGFVARMHAGKGPQLLVEALARLRRSGIPFRAALVGDGPLADEVCRQVRRERLCDVVRVLPFGGDPWPVLAALDVYVLPSLWESMPIGVLEAMAAGLPVIAADTGGVAEAVVSGETGLLHLPGDVDGLVGALQRLLCQPELRRRMGQAGRRRQQERYSLEAMVEGTLAAYERAWTG